MLVGACLAKFEKQGLAVHDAASGYSYRPATSAIGALCDAVEVAFRQRPVATISLISAPENGLQRLADAFKFRNPKT